MCETFSTSGRFIGMEEESMTYAEFLTEIKAKFMEADKGNWRNKEYGAGRILF